MRRRRARARHDVRRRSPHQGAGNHRNREGARESFHLWSHVAELVVASLAVHMLIGSLSAVRNPIALPPVILQSLPRNPVAGSVPSPRRPNDGTTGKCNSSSAALAVFCASEARDWGRVGADGGGG
jgi:hypothetical protein